MSWYLGSFHGGDYQYLLYTRYANFKNKYLFGFLKKILLGGDIDKAGVFGFYFIERGGGTE